jgi:FSR family fosmidomycin resistance protein-like MFS transporter
VTGAVALASERQRNTAASLFTVGGTTGYALGPLITVGVLAALGIRGTPVFLVPGLLIAWVLYRSMLHVDRQRQRHRQHEVSNPSAAHWTDLVRVIVVVMLRSWVFLSLLQFVPVWYDELGYDRAFYGALSTIIILSGVAGTLTGGALADRIGGKAVIATTLAACAPALLLFAGFPGTIALLTGAVFGFLSDASLSVTLVAAQRLLPGRPGIASGIILGLGFVTGGLGVPMTGALADRVGIGQALMMLSVLSVTAALLALTIPRRAFGRGDTHHRLSDSAEQPAIQAGPAVPAMEIEQ